MATNVVAAVINLATASLKSGHKLHGAVMEPSKWATEAGFPGSKASPLREHMARKSENGCGRSGRYPKVDAKGLLDLLAEADAYVEAETKAEEDKHRRNIRKRLTEYKAQRTQATTGTTKRTTRKGAKDKAEAKAS